ncbi:MAG: hypothetical protein LQ339_006093, partial [Xanthoria mediterranea]
KHLETIRTAAKKSHFWQFGGALLDDVPQAGQSLKIRGSVILVQEDTRERVLQVLRQDIYHIRGIWDLEQAQIYPVSSASRRLRICLC